ETHFFPWKFLTTSLLASAATSVALLAMSRGEGSCCGLAAALEGTCCACAVALKEGCLAPALALKEGCLTPSLAENLPVRRDQGHIYMPN
ncbi:hypothetical protein HAX54_004294, partial [Datura stramonium]|nr:hypothetical protein [Datura stramonium]